MLKKYWGAFAPTPSYAYATTFVLDNSSSYALIVLRVTFTKFAHKQQVYRQIFARKAVGKCW
jgi:hypothetical protein